MAEFKVGDEVRVLAGGEGFVTYGPVNSTFDTYKIYVVKQEGDDERAFKSSDLEPVPPAFTVGDIVTLSTRGARATVEYGPFDDRDVYVVKLLDEPADGNPRTFTALASVMTKVPALVPVGTRVRVDRAEYAEYAHGLTGEVTSNTDTWTPYGDVIHPYSVRMDDRTRGTIHAAEVTPIHEPPAGFEYEGTVYECGVTYEDKDGDRWRFDRPRDGGEPLADDTSCWLREPLSDVVRAWGPLTKQ
ncbi:phiSA1p31-related protein [Streptomyces sp. NPDC057509]|uniref:phiSA1p31-related protein n=1 Tax=Streptomyces sp. NPDC057509 TaxID=3346152 RepID=UPI0036786A71